MIKVLLNEVFLHFWLYVATLMYVFRVEMSFVVLIFPSSYYISKHCHRIPNMQYTSLINSFVFLLFLHRRNIYAALMMYEVLFQS